MDGILAIESSQRTICVAVRNRAGEVVERTPLGDPRERDLLLPAIIEVCEAAKMQREDLRAVAVSTGPGGFTGLRVSIATAKGICEALSIPALDVPTALVAAMGCRAAWWPQGRRVAVALAGKGSACWMSSIEIDEAGELAVRDARWVDATEFDPTDARTLIADEHLPLQLRERALAVGMTILPPHFSARDCLSVAQSMYARGEVCDAGSLAVRYPREPEAVTLWKARYPEGFPGKK
ncbi:MAG: tRNA (adenosine(37)-N6)-threonylcarbamoyltransferase complex dimerization subunit type 1 TsaB [Phycisphaerales bacterium]|nr:tRNA (adenosine(37)-N6)-threonylcarbamoyltransferase complex dimerization subunit type 1 TsaB [Phycisphaerales bacterium]